MYFNICTAKQYRVTHYTALTLKMTYLKTIVKIVIVVESAVVMVNRKLLGEVMRQRYWQEPHQVITILPLPQYVKLA